MTKRWRCWYRRWYKKSSGRVSIVVRELSVLGKLRRFVTSASVLSSQFLDRYHRCQRTTVYRSHQHITHRIALNHTKDYFTSSQPPPNDTQTPTSQPHSSSTMASTATITPSLTPGALKSAFAKLDDDLFNSLAASQPGSPSLGATKISPQPPDTSSHLTSLSQQPQQKHQQTPTSAPTSSPLTTSKPKLSSAVLALLTTPNMTASSIEPLITPDAMLLCPHW
jgi:hypothetical protein